MHKMKGYVWFVRVKLWCLHESNEEALPLRLPMDHLCSTESATDASLSRLFLHVYKKELHVAYDRIRDPSTTIQTTPYA